VQPSGELLRTTLGWTAADPRLAVVDGHRLWFAGSAGGPPSQRTTNLELERTRGIRLFN
jgi:hypothetical protein